MAFKKVVRYALGYDVTNKQLHIDYELEGDANAYQFFPDPAGFAGLAELFRSNSVVNYETTQNYFVSKLRKPGT